MLLANDLKKSLLQYAIQGRLVTNHEKYGNAEDLCKHILDKKNKLVSKGKNKPSISLINDEEKPFEIPDNWMWVRLGDLFIIDRGSSPRPIKEYLTKASDGVNWIKIGDSEVGAKYITQTSEKITPKGAEKSRKVEKGDFIISNSMSFGRPYIMAIDGYVHDGWNIIHFISDDNGDDLLDKNYIYYVLSSDLLKQQIKAKAAGGVVQNIRSDKLKELIIPIPPLAEQTVIASKIDKILPEIEAYGEAEKEWESLQKAFPDDIRKSILQYAMKGKLVEQLPEEGTGEDLYEQLTKERKKLAKEGKIKKDNALSKINEDEIPFDIPESWMWVKLCDLVVKNIKRGKAPVYTTKSDEILVFAQKCNVKNGGINLELAQYLDKQYLEKYSEEEYMVDQDIVINSTGTGTLGRIGIYTIADNKDQKIVVSDSHVTIVRLGNPVISRYVYYILKNYQKYLESKGEGSTKQKELKPDTIKNLLIPLPPLGEQERIINKLEAILPLVNDLSGVV